MKKLYLDPDFEIVNIRLVADVLKSSTDFEDSLPGIDGGDDDDFENGGGFDTIT